MTTGWPPLRMPTPNPRGDEAFVTQNAPKITHQTWISMVKEMKKNKEEKEKQEAASHPPQHSPPPALHAQRNSQDDERSTKGKRNKDKIQMQKWWNLKTSPLFSFLLLKRFSLSPFLSFPLLHLLSSWTAPQHLVVCQQLGSERHQWEASQKSQPSKRSSPLVAISLSISNQVSESFQEMPAIV